MAMLMTDNLDVTLSAGYSPVSRRHTAQKLYGDGYCSSSSAIYEARRTCHDSALGLRVLPKKLERLMHRLFPSRILDVH